MHTNQHTPPLDQLGRANDRGHVHTLLTAQHLLRKLLLYQNPTLQKCKEELL